MFSGLALNKYPLIGWTILPARGGIHVIEPAGFERPADLAESSPFRPGLDGEVGEAGDVMGIGTDEFRHDQFQFHPGDDELGGQTGRFALQYPVDEFDGLIHLPGGISDPFGIELQVNPADGDGFHFQGFQGHWRTAMPMCSWF